MSDLLAGGWLWKGKYAPPISCSQSGLHSAISPSRGVTFVNTANNKNVKGCGGGTSKENRVKKEQRVRRGCVRSWSKLQFPTTNPTPWMPRELSVSTLLVQCLGKPTSQGCCSYYELLSHLLNVGFWAPLWIPHTFHKALNKNLAVALLALAYPLAFLLSGPFSHMQTTSTKWERQRQLPQQSSHRRRGLMSTAAACPQRQVEDSSQRPAGHYLHLTNKRKTDTFPEGLLLMLVFKIRNRSTNTILKA